MVQFDSFGARLASCTASLTSYLILLPAALQLIVKPQTKPFLARYADVPSLVPACHVGAPDVFIRWVAATPTKATE